MEQQTQPQSENNAGDQIKIEDPAAVLNALERAKAEAKKFREEKEQLEKDLEDKSQLAATYSSKLLQEKVKSTIEATGAKDPGRFMKLIDFNQISLNENNEIVGFDEQFNTLKQDFPEVFDPKLRVGGQADTAAATSVSTKISATELQARKILGKI